MHNYLWINYFKECIWWINFLIIECLLLSIIWHLFPPDRNKNKELDKNINKHIDTLLNSISADWRIPINRLLGK
jgi:hypothetical protein